jgi:mono/diheme cytochrome c family protein
MYRGIIQEGNWVKEGSYLRGVVKARGLDKHVSKGRIYRIVHEDMKPGPKPELLKKSADDLLEYLGHPNGWWRMTAQKLIVLKNDRTVIPDLIKIVEGNESFFAKTFSSDKDFGIERVHALWTLEGMKAVDKALLKTAYKDKDYRVRVAAIRISDPFIRKNDTEIFDAAKSLADDPHPEVLQQLILSLRLNNANSKAVVKSILDKHGDNEVIRITAAENLNPAFSEIQGLREKYRLKGGDAANQIVNGYKIFKEYCSTCHGPDGKGIHQLAPSLVGSPRVTGDVETTIKILLHGLTGPVNGVEFNGPMAPVGQQNDEYIADVISYVREHLNNSGTVWRGRVRTTREKYKDRDKYWTLKELEKTKTK